jgi:hypothetical protein
LQAFNIYRTRDISYFYAKVVIMKKSIFLLLTIIAFASCNNKPITSKLAPAASDSTTVDKIASRAGYANWDKVKELAFTFNVGNMGSTVLSREWTWNPQTGDVLMIAVPDTVRYNRLKAMNTLQIAADKHFINDSYWLLAAFKFKTDQGTTTTEKSKVLAPISKDTLNMFTVTYGNNGGYTPGDAYDMYYDKNYDIKEWVFRKGNDPKPSLMTTFENIETHSGLRMPTDYRLPDRMSRINFTNIKVTTI